MKVARLARPRRPARVAAIVLAAGASTRMSPRNKLLVTDDAGLAMVARVAAACHASLAHEVVVVTGHQAEAVMAAVRHSVPDARFVHAAHHADGLSASLRTGLSALAPDIAAALICLGDMPLVSPADMDRLIRQWSPEEQRLIIVPSYRGICGNPVLWDRRFFAEMKTLEGDTGARVLIARYSDTVSAIDLESDAILVDFDTVDALREHGLLAP